MNLGAAMPLAASDSGPLVRGVVRASDHGGWVDYDASYAVESGALLDSFRAGGKDLDSVPTQFGEQALEQRLRAALPVPLGAPLRLRFASGQHASFTGEGMRRSETGSAGVDWAGGPLDLSLRWTVPGVGEADELDCGFQGSLRLADGFAGLGDDAALGVSQRQCRVIAPVRGLAGSTVESWGAHWRWGDDFQHTLRVRRVALDADAWSVAEAPGYELGWTHSRVLGAWSAEADLALRRVRAPLDGAALADADTRWAADLALRRQLRDFAVTARWAHAQDPLWFAPNAARLGTQRLSLGVDLDRWLAAIWPHAENTRMGASWEWEQTAAAGEFDIDSRVQWDVSLVW